MDPIIDAIVRFTVQGFDTLVGLLGTLSTQTQQGTGTIGLMEKAWDALLGKIKPGGSYFKGFINGINESYTALMRLSRMGTSLAVLFGAGGRLFGGLTGGGGGFSGIRTRMNIGGILATGMKDSTEINALSAAWEKFARVVSAQVAPYVRALTQIIKELTMWWGNLDVGLKQSITKWILLASAVAVFLYLLPTLVSIITAVIQVFTALVFIMVNPFTMAIAGVFALIGALVYLFGFEDAGGARAANSLNQSNATWIDALLGWISDVEARFRNFWFYIQGGFHVLGQNIKNFFEDVLRGWIIMMNIPLEFAKGGPTAVGAYLDAERARGRQIDIDRDKKFDKWVKDNMPENKRKSPIADAISSMFGMDPKTRAAIADSLQRIKDSMGGDGFRYGTAKFESSDQTWDRLMLAAANQDGNIPKAQLNAANKANDLLQEAINAIRGIPAPVR